MYYRLGPVARGLWNFIVFLIWCYVTWNAMRLAINIGWSPDEAHTHARHVDINPAVADVLMLFKGLLAFFGVPIFTTYFTILINKKLKGVPHEEQRENRTDGGGRKRLPPPPRPL